MATSSLVKNAGCTHFKTFQPFTTGTWTRRNLLSTTPFVGVNNFNRRSIVNAGRLSTQVRAEASTSEASTKQFVEDNSFRVEKISFGSILTPIGVGFMVYGFGAFFQLLPGSDISSILLVYGFPLSLLGFALSYAQLKPVPCKTTQEAMALRDTQATNIQKQVREDVTRFRYGDEQHLDEALNRIFIFNRPKGIPRRLSPKLVGVREDVLDGNYALILEFETKPEMVLDMWESRLPKIQSFFGPGIVASLQPTEQGMDVILAVDGSGSGRGDSAQQEVLPPLMPGLKPRVKQ